MKTWICVIFASVAALSAAEKPAAKDPDKPAAAKAAPAPRAPAVVTVPAGAVKTEAGNWHYTDPQGRKWIYRQTPWGMAKFEESQTVTPSAESRARELELLRAFEDGDAVRFERPGPFGTFRWSRPKSQLTELEQQAWERDRKSAAPQKEKQE